MTVENLDGTLPVQRQITGAIYYRHAPLSDLFKEPIVPKGAANHPRRVYWSRPAKTSDACLELALVAVLLMHGVAMLAMAGLLLPALPGGGAEALLRVQYVAAHPWRLRLGWLPWQLCAVCDLWLAVALLRAPFIPRAAAALVALCTLAGIGPDQWAQWMWVTRGVELARAAVATPTGDLSAYLRFERLAFDCTAGWGALFYTLAGLGWTWCFAVACGRAHTWNRWLTGLSLLLWPLMLGISVVPLLPWAPSPAAIALLNALGFVLLMAWLALVAEAVLRRTRPFLPHGCTAPWRHPASGLGGAIANLIGNSRLLAQFTRALPLLEMQSDISDVVYVNYIVPAERLLPLTPEGLELQRLGPGGAYGLFTFLTFRHGHFGFRFLGPLRRLLPSPIQSNWRIHVRDPRTQTLGIYFVSNATTSTLHALAARLLTDGMPMHVLAHAELEHAAGPAGTIKLRLEPGPGTAPDAVATLVPDPSPEPALAAPFSQCFASFRDFLAYCVPQDRAMSTQPHLHRVTRHEIDLGIPISACEPLLPSGAVQSRAVDALIGEAAPLCFRVPSVLFRFAGSVHDPLP